MFATQTSDVRYVRINLIWDTALSGNGQQVNLPRQDWNHALIQNSKTKTRGAHVSLLTCVVFILTETHGTKPQELLKPPKQETPSRNIDTKKSSRFPWRVCVFSMGTSRSVLSHTKYQRQASVPTRLRLTYTKMTQRLTIPSRQPSSFTNSSCKVFWEVWWDIASSRDEQTIQI
jgi:hypothetical protein